MCEIQVKGFDLNGKQYMFGQVAFNLSPFINKFDKGISIQLIKPFHTGSKIAFKVSIASP